MGSYPFSQYIAGELVLPGDVNSDNDAVRQLVGNFVALLLGGENYLPQNGTFAPLAIALAGSGLSFIIGGPGQAIIAQHRVCDTCPAQSITIAANNGSVPRTDLVSIAYEQIEINGQPRQLSDGSSGTVYQLEDGVQYAYATGTTSPQAGFVPFAEIVVPPGATNATQCTVTYLFPTISQALAAVLGGLVQSINGLSGPITLAEGTNITLSKSGQTITISAASVGAVVNALNGLSGTIEIEEGVGISVVADGNTIVISSTASTPVQTLNGQSGAVRLAQGAGISITPSGGVITISAAVTSVDGQSGAVVLPNSGMVISRANVLSGSSTTVTLPTLGTGTWDVYADGWINASATASLVGSGIAEGWTLQNPTRAGTAIPYSLQLYAVASGGDTPSAVLSGASAGLLRIWAVCR